MNNDEKFKVSNLKSLLYVKLQELSKTKFEYYEVNKKIEILNEFFKLFEGNLNDVLTNRMKLNQCLELFFQDNNYFVEKFNKILDDLEKNKEELSYIEKEVWMNELSTYKLNLITIYDELKLKMAYLEKNKNDFFIYKKILNSLTYHQMITKREFRTIFDFMKEQNIDNRTIILICEQIRIHCNEVNKSFDRNFDKYRFLNILNTGYEQFPEINIINKKEIEQKANIILSMQKLYENNIEDFAEQLPVFDSRIISTEEYKCLYVEIMKQLQFKIKDLVDMASDEEFYMNDAIKSMIIKDYNKLLNFYRVIRDFFDNQIDNERENNRIISDESEKIKSIDTNIYFLVSNDDGKSFFENDLKSVPEEYYDKVVSLLQNKKYNQLGAEEDKQLKSHEQFKKYRELRNDQVRIIYRNLDNNDILVLGVGVKKADVDIPLFKRLTSRFKFYDEVLQKDFNQEEIYDRIVDYCEAKHRKGNR